MQNNYQLTITSYHQCNYQLLLITKLISTSPESALKKYEQDLCRETDMGSWIKGERGKDKVRKDNLIYLIIRERAEVGDIEENLYG